MVGTRRVAGKKLPLIFLVQQHFVSDNFDLCFGQFLLFFSPSILKLSSLTHQFRRLGGGQLGGLLNKTMVGIQGQGQMKRETKEGGNLREEEESISQKEEKVACVIS